MPLTDEKVDQHLTVAATGGGVAVEPSLLATAKEKAMYRLAQLINLPALQQHIELPITVNTIEYDLGISAEQIDRIVVVNYVSSAGTKTNLDGINNRDFEIYYRTEALTGKPDRFTIWANLIKIYPIPDEAGTLYIDYLRPVSSLSDIDVKYFSLYLALAEQDIFEKGSPKWIAAVRNADDQIEQRKGQIEPIKEGFEGTSYRKLQIMDINNL